MGEVMVSVQLRNFWQIETVARGLIPEFEVTSLTVDMVVDTGAVMILLPQDMVEKLDLSQSGKVIVTYADERKEERDLAKGLEVTVGDRSMVTDCIVGPPACEPLLGQIVLEELDLIVDCGRKALVPRPESPFLPLLKMK